MNKYWNCKIIFTIFIFLFFIGFSVRSINAVELTSCTFGQTYCTSDYILLTCIETSNPAKWSQSGCKCHTGGTGAECDTTSGSDSKCTKAADCDDKNSCTTDTCNNGGTTSASCSNIGNGTCWVKGSCDTTTGNWGCTSVYTGTYDFTGSAGDCMNIAGCEVTGGGSGATSTPAPTSTPGGTCTPTQSCEGAGYSSTATSCYQRTISNGCNNITCYDCNTPTSTPAPTSTPGGTCTPSCSSLDPSYYSSLPDGHSCTFQTFENNCHTGNIDCYYNCSDLASTSTPTPTLPPPTATPTCTPAGVCPTTCHTNTVTVPNGSCGTISCPPNAPSAVACPTCLTVGSTVPDGSCGDNTCIKNCDWVCADGSCNYPPVINGLIIKNSGNTLVSVEVGTTRNQICDTDFNGSRRVTFEINASDVNIGDNLNYSLSWNGKTIPVPGGVGTTVIPVGFNNSGLYPFIVTVNDGHNIGVTSSPRTFKFWDCKVPVSGTIYNGSDGLSCPDTGFSTKAVKDILNFKSLTFVSVGSSLIITPNPDGVSYTSGSNGLTWGLDSYIPHFNLNDSKIVLSFPKMKSQISICDWWLDTTHLDAYLANIGFTADFSGKTDQDPWWQAINGGVIGNSQISNQIPFTCTANECRISFNGLAAAPIINNAGDLISFQDWSYLAKLADVNKNYSYFYTQYFVKNGVGTTLDGDKNITDIGSTGIYFVNGNLAIGSNKTINPGDFLMIVVNGNITVNQNVTQVDGILVANNINAAGTSDDQLVFNGSLFASGTINFSRGYTVKSTNNTVPAVKVNYNPELMFKIPGKVAQILSNWQWGN